MIWKIILIAFLAVGTFAEKEGAAQAIGKQSEDFIKNLCIENNAENVTENVEEQIRVFMGCLKDFMDSGANKEAEVYLLEARSTQRRAPTAEEVKKYCTKAPQLKTCIRDLIDAVTPCLPESDRSQVPTTVNATDSLIDFACYKDGERIFTFINDKGFECIDQKHLQIQMCVALMQKTVPNLEAAYALNVTEQCAMYDDLSSCVVTAFKGCNTRTQGITADELMKLLRQYVCSDKEEPTA